MKKFEKQLGTLKLIMETITITAPVAKWVLIAVGVLGLVMYVKNGDQDEMDKYIAEYKQYKQQAEVATKYADSLKTEITIADNEARAAQSRAQTLNLQVRSLTNETSSMVERATILQETLTDTLELARQLLPLKDSIIAKQKETIEVQGSQVKELESALENKDTALRMALIRGDSLQTIINLIPPAPKNPNRIFGIKLPSRKASFIVGVGMGLGASLLVIK